ncbi:cyclase family protein [Nocardia sp. NPDC051570]|uniref:cyclase family protein n=1 Tax=Nocardia sp. NPDC051570 TaxID=3364324 RepID=UPI0037921C46
MTTTPTVPREFRRSGVFSTSGLLGLWFILAPQVLDRENGLMAEASAGEIFVDMTYALDFNTPVFPGEPPFCFDVQNRIGDPDLPLYFGRLEMMEHTGTHIDAPAHVVVGGATVDRLPLQQLVGPGVVIDCVAECADNPDYQVPDQAILRFEAEHRPLGPSDVVMFRTGWDRFYSDPERYIHAGDRWAWPGVSVSAAELLAQRGVRGIGLDTIGLDAGCIATELRAHRAMLSSGAFIVENVANLALLPPIVDEILALPINVRNGSGGPSRVFARIASPGAANEM